MVHDRLLDRERLEPFKLLILPNIACLSDRQCDDLRAFVRAAPDVMARAKELKREPFDLNGIREAIKPWGERLRDRRFETEGEWKLKLAGGTRGTVEVLTRELRDALR